MRTLFKFLLGLAALSIVAVISLLIAIATVDPNDHKDWLANKVQEDTGRTVVLDGDINLIFYPWLGLEANNITVGNAEGFGEEPFVHFDYIRIRIKLVPIFSERYEVDTIKIHGAVINLVINKDGVSNLDDLGGQEKQEKEPVSLAALILGGIDIRDASLTLSDQAADTYYKISNTNIKTGELVYDEPVELSMTMDVESRKPEVTADFNLNGTIAYDLDNRRISIRPLALESNIASSNIPEGQTKLALSTSIELDLAKETVTITGLSLTGLGTQIKGLIRASKINRPTPDVMAELDVAGKDLALLFRVAEIEPLATRIAAISDRRFDLKASLNADMERGDVDISRFSIDLLGANINGQVKARNIQSATPGYQETIDAKGPDLPMLLQIVGQFQSGEDAVLATYGSQLTKIADAQKAFSVATKLDADLKSGDIDISELSVFTLGFSISGNLNAKDMQSDQGSVEGKLLVEGADLSKVLVALNQDAVSEVLQSFKLETSINGSGSNIELKPMSLTVNLGGEQILNPPVVLDVSATTQVNLEAETFNLNNFMVQGLGLNISGNLNANKIMQAPEFQGNIDVKSFNLRKLMQQLAMEVPKTTDKKVLSKVSFKTDLAGSANSVNFDKLQLVLDDSTLKGRVAVSDLKNSALDFNLEINQINLDRYLPPAPEGKKKTQKNSKKLPPTQLPIETLKSLNAKGEFKIGNLTVSNVKMSSVSLKLDGKNSVVKLKPVSANLYQGKYTGDVTINVSGKLPRLTINTSLKEVQAEPLLNDVTGEAKMRG